MMNQHIQLIILLFSLFNIIEAQTVQYFDGSRSLKFINEQCELGPRFPGSTGHRNAIKYFTKHFKPLGDEFTIMEEVIAHPYETDSLRMSNIFTRFNVDAPRRILLMAHWDTRKIADKDPDEENRALPILGANDGASGVAVLMVLAEMFSQNPLINLGIDILLADGEDVGHAGDSENFGLGTREFAKHIPLPRPEAAICLDMVGDAELTLPIEQYSYIQAADLVLDIWDLAAELGFTQFQKKIGMPITDDHRVLYIHSGIPAIDIIDFDYPNKQKNYWHTLEDTPDKCSSESLSVVGTVVLNYIYRLDEAMR